MVLPSRFEPLTWRGEPCQAGIPPADKKGFLMSKDQQAAARRQQRVREACEQNAAAIAEALLFHSDFCVCHQIAITLLTTANLDSAEFVARYHAGEFDA